MDKMSFDDLKLSLFSRVVQHNKDSKNSLSFNSYFHGNRDWAVITAENIHALHAIFTDDDTAERTSEKLKELQEWMMKNG